MKSIVTTFILFWLILSQASAQIPAADRLTDWSKAGIQEALPAYQQVRFTGIPTGLSDNSALLKQIFDTLTRPTIILFGEGKYLFTQKISLPDRTVLKGLGNNRTEIIINLSGAKEPGIEIRGNEIATLYTITATAFKDSSFIKVLPSIAANFKAGDYLRIINDDQDLGIDESSINRTGQIVTIQSIKADTFFLTAPLRRSFLLATNPRFRKLTMKKFCGLSCFKLERLDNTNSGVGSANIFLRNVTDCFIQSIESVRCNFAHIESHTSQQTTIENNYFHDAFSFGSGGRAYGVMLHFTSGQFLVQNNIFRRLGHAMILQIGANGNVFAYNYAFEGRKEIFTNFFVPGEDMVCHGNYPYLNLFEGNYGQFASVDDSHGANGPFNTYFRNIANTNGFSVTSPISHNQNFTANHRLAGSSSFSASGHHITDNSWQGASSLNAQSLVYTATPAFLQGQSLGAIGPPAFNSSVSIPARNRALAGTHITDPCDVIIWENGNWKSLVKPSAATSDYKLWVGGAIPLTLDGVHQLKQVEVAPGANFITLPSSQIQVKQ